MTDPHGDPDLTRRHDLPDAAPAQPTAASDPALGASPTMPGAAWEPSPTPTSPVSPGSPVSATTPDRYAATAPSDPASGWSRRDLEGGTVAPTTPERWYEPAAAVPTTPTAQPTSHVGKGSRAGTGTVLAAAVLSAALASGGTLLTLSATGALDRGGGPVPSAGTPGTTVGSQQPVTIDEQSATIDVAAQVSPAVVRITVNGSIDTNQGVIPETGVGSGVIYDAAGWILTNRHVVEGSNELEVELNDGRILSGEVYGIDTLTDLAIVKVAGADLPTAALGRSDALKVGQLVVAIGSPLGTYSNSVTSGIVSAKGRSITTDDGQNLNNLIQTDAAINPGNSGGPLLDANGQVIGINTAIAADSNGIGFAIPIDIARPIMEQAVAGQELARPYMGVNYQSITRALAEAADLPVTDGAYIDSTDDSPAVQPGTPAEEAGLQDGDIIVRVDGQAIDGEHPLDATLSQHAPGDTVSIEVLRDGQTVTLSLTLGTRPAGL